MVVGLIKFKLNEVAELAEIRLFGHGCELDVIS